MSPPADAAPLCLCVALSAVRQLGAELAVTINHMHEVRAAAGRGTEGVRRVEKQHEAPQQEAGRQICWGCHCVQRNAAPAFADVAPRAAPRPRWRSLLAFCFPLQHAFGSPPLLTPPPPPLLPPVLQLALFARFEWSPFRRPHRMPPQVRGWPGPSSCAAGVGAALLAVLLCCGASHVRRDLHVCAAVQRPPTRRHPPDVVGKSY